MKTSDQVDKPVPALPGKRLLLYTVSTTAVLAAGGSQANATPVSLDLTGLSVGTRTTPLGGDLWFDVNAASAASAVGFANFSGADFFIRHNNNAGFRSANLIPSHSNGVADKMGPDIALRFTGSQFVGPQYRFGVANNSSGDNGVIAQENAPSFANFQPGDTGYIGLRFFIGSDTHYGWANLTVNNDFSATLNALGYESVANAPAHVPVNGSNGVPEGGSSLLLLAIGAAGLLAFRARQAAAA